MPMACDRANFPGWGLDGERLHGQYGIPPEMWCITKADLIHARCCIREAVQSGRILPTEVDEAGRGDPFNPEDDAMGPNVYSVVANLIQPLSLEAGKMSWALLRNPSGLACDVFITHAWAEGSFELIDKILFSWPWQARGAWCCIFANPQNLDIGGLIRQPSDSPFAKALGQASRMMVVPNSSCSIYTRAWCVYEAYLAHTWDKPIVTASAPNPTESWQAIVSCCASTVIGIVTAFSVQAYALNFQAACCMLESPVPFDIEYLGCIIGILSQTSERQWLRLVLNNLGLVISWVGTCTLVASDRSNLIKLFQPFMVVFFLLSEVDRLRARRAKREAACLQEQFSSIVLASASNAADKAAILKEVDGQEQVVDTSISVLLAAHMSTPSLRYAASRGAVVTGAGTRQRATGWLGFSMWIAFNAFLWSELGTHAELLNYVPVLINMAAIVGYALIYVSVGLDRKAFMTSSLFRLVVVMSVGDPILSTVMAVVHPDPFCFTPTDLFKDGQKPFLSNYACDKKRAFLLASSLLFSALALITATAGIGGVAWVPCVGPRLASFLGSNRGSCLRRRELKQLRKQARDYRTGLNKALAEVEYWKQRAKDLETSASDPSQHVFV